MHKYVRHIQKTILFSTLTLASGALADAETYTLDNSHTNITWHVGHMGFSTPTGKFVNNEGTLVLDDKNPDKSKVKVTIKLSPGIQTTFDKFDKVLASKEFFDAEKFPDATFESDKIEVKGKHEAMIHGKLTMHGVTKPIVLQAKLNKIGDNPFSKKKTAGFSATTKLKRSDFDMGYLTNMGIDDEVKLDIEVEFSLADAAVPGKK